MDDFDYSVEISDRDWHRFFTECEECNLLPPSLAGVDDSGMSDLDDTASMFVKRVQKHDLAAGLSEARGPPDSRSPAVERYLGKQGGGGGGMESVLSGSEEDIHLQSVNMFFERLRNRPEAERPDEQSQAGKNQVAQLQMPENSPELNSPPARDEAAAGKDVEEPFDTISNKNTMTSVKPAEPAASNANRLASAETELFIGQETRVKPHDSPTPQTSPYTDKVMKGHVCTQLDGVRQQPHATGQNRTAAQQPSLSASVKRKRRKKRRLSLEPLESGLGCDRQVLGGQRTEDSEEERRPWRGAAGVCLSERDTAEEVEVQHRSDQAEELSGLNEYCWLPRPVAGKLHTSGATGNGERTDARAESLQPHNDVNHVVCEAEVKSLTRSISPRADPDVEVSQNDKLSVAKSVLAVEGGYSGRSKDTPCQREAEQQRQLEMDTHQYSSTPGKTGVCESGSASTLPRDLTCKEAGATLAERCTNSSSCTECGRESELLASPSDVTPLPSCRAAEQVTGGSASISQNESEGEIPAVTFEEDAAELKSRTLSNSDAATGAGDAITPPGADQEPGSKQSVFTMSSFWSEMEKLTINDILRLRLADKAAPHGSLPPLQEHEEMFSTHASSIFTQLDESVPDSQRSRLASVMAPDPSSSRSVTWESETVPVSVAADVYPQNMTPTSAVSPAVFPGRAETCLRKISKNVSVHNLHALESGPFSSAPKRHTLPSSDKGGVEKVTEDVGPGKVDGASPLTGSYTTSIVDVFRYFFGGKEPVPSPSATDTLTPTYAEGNTLPETYDHFFSDFDTESFFSPLIPTAEAKDELVPIFSFSRSANRNLQFPEAYDYFFASSSSDESDEDESSGPVRVVSRFTQETGSSVSVDAYEHFFTDRDVGQNLFWKDTLSFRNVNLTVWTSQKPSLSDAMQNAASPRRAVCPGNVVGNRDVAFPDPLLYHLEDRISKQLSQQPVTYVSNPSKYTVTVYTTKEISNLHLHFPCCIV